MTEPFVEITRREEFSAAHRLHNPSFSDEGHLSGVDESLRLRRARAHLTTVMDLLNHIGELGMTLDTFPQRAFDEWVAIRGRRGRDATRFMRWARVQRLTQGGARARVVGARVEQSP